MKYKFENGIELLYDDDKHSYTIDGKIVPSVTKILNVINKPNLLYWAVNSAIRNLQSNISPKTKYTEENLGVILNNARNTPNKIKNTSAKLGTKVHKALELIIDSNKKQEEITDERVKDIIMKFMEWWQTEKPDLVFVESERPVYSPSLNYCGTFDFIAKEGEDIIIGDFKTSNNVYPEHYLQTAAYQKAFEEETKTKVTKRMIIRIDKEGKGVECHETDEFKEDFKAFEGALTLYNRLLQL